MFSYINQDVVSRHIANLRDYACISAAYQEDLWASDSKILAWAKKYSRYIVIGIGGSSLCGQAIKCACKDTRVTFIDNIYQYDFIQLFRNFQYADTGILVISKSGETVETLAQLSLILQKFYHNNTSVSDHFLVITENKDSTLMKFCRQHNTLYIEHDIDIGGRFSVFSPVGILPAYLMGCDIKKFKHGAKDAVESKAFEQGTDFVIKSYNHGRTNNVFMCYSSKLEKFQEWIAQLYAESSGKDGKGITPLLAKGTVDQHSQLQLYAGGPDDKCYTIFIEKERDLLFFDSTTPCKMLVSHSLNELFIAEANATVASLRHAGRPIRVFESETIDEYTLGWLFMHFLIEIINVCNELNVNPFGQPHVEYGKRIVLNQFSEN